MTDREGGITDCAVKAAVSEPATLARGFLDYLRYQVSLTLDGDTSARQTRDIVRAGRVAAVLPIDLARGHIVLMRQFRLAAHLATGRGQLIEIVAGRVDDGESAEAAGRRECLEEIGLAPARMVELFSVLSTPGLTDEYVTFFLAEVDTSDVPARGGRDATEDVRPFVVEIDDALAALEAGTMANALLVSALQWLAIHRGELQAWFDRGSIKPAV